jgi:hypothetical protein
LLNDSSTCYENMPINYKVRNETFNGFLADGIIRQSSKTTNCEQNHMIAIIGDEKITYRGKLFYREKNKFSKQKISIMNHNISMINLRHNSILVEDIERLNEMIRVEKSEEEFGKILVKRSFKQDEDEFINEMKEAFTKYWTNSKRKIMMILFIIGGVIILSIIVSIIIKIMTCFDTCKRCIACMKCKKKRKNTQIMNVNLARMHTTRLNDSTPDLDPATKKLLSRLNVR